MLCASIARRLLRSSSLPRVIAPTTAIATTRRRTITMAPKRKAAAAALTNGHASPPQPPPKRRASARNVSTSAAVETDPDVNPNVIDAPDALRASPDSDVNEEIVPGSVKVEEGGSPLSDVPDIVEPVEEKVVKKKKAGKKVKIEGNDSETNKKKPAKKAAMKKEDKESTNTDDPLDHEAEPDDIANEDEIKEALGRPPPVNSDYLPLPWKGRLGYACLNTYLRNSNPPVFSSRTCRIQSILEHRHPLQDPSQPEHATKNRPDKSKPADVELGRRYVEALGVANAKDIVKMIKWNERYHIKFLRLSSEMFPFASHSEYGYKLTPFASEALAEAGKVIAELGHRVTTHPGQFTQLGSPRASVVENAKRDLDYHDELLSLLKLPEQEDRDAVMILHMGGIFEGKAETLDRFRKNYAELPDGVKKRLVLENDDVCWTVHDLLPICEELNIPLVLDFHHHNILFDSSQIREGTHDITLLYPRIRKTWTRKHIRQKMHYSEPTPAAITGRQRRKHNPRVFSLPPCADDMDLMIEAKDKEQAVFELMRNFRLPGHGSFSEVLPYMRGDDNKVAMAVANKKGKKSADEVESVLIPEEEVGMGGPEGRVYWPMGMEEYLRPKKREVKKKAEPKSSEQLKKQALELYSAREAEKAAAAKQNGIVNDEEEEESDTEATPATKKAKAAMRAKVRSDAKKEAVKVAAQELKAQGAKSKKVVGAGKKGAGASKKKVKKEEEEEEEVGLKSDEEEEEEEEELELHDDDDEKEEVHDGPVVKKAPQSTRTTAGRRSAKGKVNYNEEEGGEDDN